MCSVRLEVCQSATTVVKVGFTLLGPMLSKEKVLKKDIWFCHHPLFFPGIPGLVCSWKRGCPFWELFVRDLHLCPAVGAFASTFLKIILFLNEEILLLLLVHPLVPICSFCICAHMVPPSTGRFCAAWSAVVCFQAHNHFLLHLLPLTLTAFWCPLSPPSFTLSSLALLVLGAASHNLHTRHVADYQSGAFRNFQKPCVCFECLSFSRNENLYLPP